ncbi:MAG: hypothetical protein JXR48_13590 [Candidatus Delongbacteria bacterium]|nr:hypothetical protein [Candidatus Delongbacteria bacterium]MBN2835989.1 hypothetical protein [Candidatus Delongbacteria bacterium]
MKIIIYLILISLTISCIDGEKVKNNLSPQDYHTEEQLGRHIVEDCNVCHIDDSEYKNIQCISCHTEMYDTAKVPNHKLNNIQTTCYECHQMTEYTVDYHNIGKQCINCHATERPGSDSYVNHFTNLFSSSCETCHNDSDWYVQNYTHTKLVIGEYHQIYTCIACHFDNYIDNRNVCLNCHIGEDQNEIHQYFENNSNCLDCHTDLDNWNVQNYSHSFVIEGEHATYSCSTCHLGIPPEDNKLICFYCHEDDFNSHHEPTEDTACYTCHNQVNWNE